MAENKYASRKFIISVTGVLGTFALAYFGKMTGDVAIVVSAAIASYNWANSRMQNNA